MDLYEAIEKRRTIRVFKSGATEEQLRRALKQKTGFQNASVVAVCTKQKESVNGWLAVENMSLAAVAEGLGSNIISYWEAAKKEAEKALGLPAEYELTCVLKFGVPKEEARPPERRPEWSWLHKNKF
jgi:nitroreductase